MLEQNNIPEILEPERFPRPLRFIVRWLARIFIFSIAIFLLAFLLLQIPSVQNWTAQKVTHFLSKELNTKVSLDHISLEFFDKVVLEGVYIEDFDGDTLLYSKRIRANLNTGPISWFNRHLAFEDIALSGTFLNIKKKDGATDSNLNAFLNQFKKKDPNKKNPFFFNIEQLLLKNIKVLNINEVAGETQSYIVESGTIDVEIINLPAKKYFIKSVKLKKPAFTIEKYQPGNQPPPREDQIADADSTSTNVDTAVFQLKIRALQLTEGSFVMDNFRHSAAKMLPDSIFDPQHLKFKDINMNHENLVFSEGQLNSFLKHLSLEESSGFKVLQLTAKEFKLANNALIFNQMNLETPYSSLGDTFAMKFRNFGDFSNFNDKVLMQAHFKDASFAVKDIMVFAPALQRNTFFQNNRDEILTIDGEISGRVNNLRGRELNIKLARGAIFEGDFSSRNLAVHDEEFLNLRVEQLRTTMKTVKEILPKFNLPANF
ncbi:MAG TPA: hypothetical protein PKC40_06005, partial [Saprospiraceae bacterium]|nr:hypothetical protein [Saprospiraceae bacterium]